ncbi:hypothetical protein [Streptobacillus moniliformis]|uniref:hypothetical protein n=2 Tax=Streptobacillus moniliformis TaxID=34105 RepID=UPI0007E4A597|nr:hypothetical protein [Streptobacillus moniliformis]
MLKKHGSYGLAQVYVSCKNKGYNRSFGSMCRINYPSEKVQVDIKYIPNECIKFNSKGIRYYQITAIDEYSRKEFRSEEELIENVKRHERLYNNRAKTVLNFKSPNEVVRE